MLDFFKLATALGIPIAVGLAGLSYSNPSAAIFFYVVAALVGMVVSIGVIFLFIAIYEDLVKIRKLMEAETQARPIIPIKTR